MTLPRVIGFFVFATLLGKLVGSLSLDGWLVGVGIVLVLAFGWQLFAPDQQSPV